MSDDKYEAAYRRANPKLCPLNPWERQAELRDLWPEDQEKFKQLVDAVSEAREQ